MAHAPSADRTGNAASKLLSVLTASSGANLHDAHTPENTESKSEEPEVGDKLFGGVDDLGRGRERFRCLCRACLLGRVERVIQLVVPAAQAAEGAQGRAELGSDDLLDRVVAAGGTRCSWGRATSPWTRTTSPWKTVSTPLRSA